MADNELPIKKEQEKLEPTVNELPEKELDQVAGGSVAGTGGSGKPAEVSDFSF